ncbi:PadR family transcriptional regulator [Nocardia sp. CDC160]|uniref:PadR family transcriptional regulator n=1 Tax=Nocardia sp. CDC160 TaxID=3112166 RepID=UPI002DBF35D7|nr:PadR family transcriptional regulator [Nocardia sp. CDC160]MEC3917533.1 PadR family transcriptional regulator [Nocardia sp. CDC160]
MAPRLLRTPVTLAVLGLLAEKPRHGYEMRTVMRERGHDAVLKLKNASMYDAVRRLTAAGLIEAGEAAREGNRPERTVYRITESGLRTLAQWLRELLGDPAHDQAAFTTALLFMFALPESEVIDLVTQRAQRIAEQIDAVDAAVAAVGEVPAIFLTDQTYGQTLRRAEHEWLVTFADDLRTGRLVWPKGFE